MIACNKTDALTVCANILYFWMPLIESVVLGRNHLYKKCYLPAELENKTKFLLGIKTSAVALSLDVEDKWL